jgi:hypothetical protein
MSRKSKINVPVCPIDFMIVNQNVYTATIKGDNNVSIIDWNFTKNVLYLFVLMLHVMFNCCDIKFHTFFLYRLMQLFLYVSFMACHVPVEYKEL